MQPLGDRVARREGELEGEQREHHHLDGRELGLGSEGQRVRVRVRVRVGVGSRVRVRPRRRVRGRGGCSGGILTMIRKQWSEPSEQLA